MYQFHGLRMISVVVISEEESLELKVELSRGRAETRKREGEGQLMFMRALWEDSGWNKLQERQD